jgi:hypothetical protein
MKTGLVESWAKNPSEMGPLYPFVGLEIPLFLICFVVWVLYTVWQMKFELSNHAREREDLSQEDRLLKTIEDNRRNH